MNTNPLISIIVPNYNGARYLDSMIDSVESQTLTDWELLIIDDKSTDESVEVITKRRKKNSKIILHVMEKNSGGPARPRNIGMSVAKGKYLAFLDSDDMWHPKKLEIQIEMMTNNAWDFTWTDVCEFDRNEDVAGCMELEVGNDALKSKLYTHTQMLRKNRIRSGSTAILTKEIVDKNEAKFREDKQYVAVEDYRFWLDILATKRVSGVRLIAPLTFYRNSASSISQQKRTMAKKIFNLLSDYRIRGNTLRYRKYYYFGTYMIYSFLGRSVFTGKRKCSKRECI